jgi:hypothetical protein
MVEKDLMENRKNNKIVNNKNDNILGKYKFN